MNKNANKKVLYALPLLLWSACQAQSPQTTQAPAKANPDRSTANSASQNNTTAIRQTHTRTYPALHKHSASGQIQLKANQLVLSLELYPEANKTSETNKSHATNFQTQLLNLNTATKLQAIVTDSHGKTYQPNGADGNGAINYSGGTITLTFDNLVPDELLLVEVQAKNGTTDIVQADLAAVLKHTTAASNPSSTINFQTTVAAKAMKALLANDAERARVIDLTALNTLTTAITGVSGTAPNLSYAQNHPSLVNTALLASHLQAQNPASLTAADYRQSGAAVNLNVSGLENSDQLQVQITDAASAVQTDLGNGNTTVNGVATGGPIQILASAFGTPAQDYTYSVSPATITPSEGNTLNVTVTATPVLNINSFSPAAGAAGTEVTLNGAGFNGTTTVSVGGANASFTYVNDSTLRVTVPPEALDGLITVTNNGTANSASNFDVYRRIYVNDDAPGSNTGTSWANAYTNLQTALGAAGAYDEIWIAAGTYTPHASNRNMSFTTKANVNIHGGFAGTETALDDRTSSLTDYVTVLSGDLSGNDTTGGDMSENTKVLINASAGNTLIEGISLERSTEKALVNTEEINVTLENMTIANHRTYDSYIVSNTNPSSNAEMRLRNVIVKDNIITPDVFARSVVYNRGTMHLENVSFINNNAESGALKNLNILNGTNVTFKDNIASDLSSVGGFYNSGNASLVKTYFINNTASGSFSTGGLSNGGSLSLEEAYFIDNRASGSYSSGGMSNRVNASVKQAYFINNTGISGSGAALSNTNGGQLNLSNSIFANNNTGSALHNSSGADSFLNNVTFSNNTVGTSQIAGGTASLTNVLFWNSSLGGPLGTNGSLVASSDPFTDSSDPNGEDNLFRTADDGLRIAPTATAVINQGVTGPEVPATDILNNGRVSNPEPGAYEYTP